MIIKKINFFMNENIVKKTIFNNLPPFDFCYLDEKNKEKIAKFVLLIGKNGSGKTCLLTLIQKLFDNHEEIYDKQYENPSDPEYDAKNYKLNDCPYAKIKINLCDGSVYFFFKWKPINDKIFDYTTPLNCRVLHENNIWKPLPLYSYFTSTTYGNDTIITKYWKNLYDHEYKEKLNRNKYESQKQCYKDDILAINRFDYTGIQDISCNWNLDILRIYKNWLQENNIKMGTAETDGKKFFCNFTLCGNQREISQLPSGWKHQIALRSIMCLHYESIFLIDEPENSLYPSEQIKLINFFIENSQKRTRNHQFFIATHSPFIIKNFLNRNDAVIINVETGENILKSEKKKLLLNDNNISYDEISYLYYDIITSSYYISLYEELKNKVGCESYKEMDDWLKENKDKINEIIKEKKLDKNNFVEIEKIKCIKHWKLNNDGEIIEEKRFEQSKKQLIVFYLGELEDENYYTNWDSFVAKFKDENWKKEEKNMKIIGELCAIWKCQSNEIYDKINGLDEEIKDQAKKLFENKQHDTSWTTSTNLTRLRHMFAHAWTKEKNFLYYKNHSEQFKNANDDEIAETNEFYSFFKNENITNEKIESLLKKYIELMRLVLINYCKITKLKPK